MAAGNTFDAVWDRTMERLILGPNREPRCVNCHNIIRPPHRDAHPSVLQPLIRYWTADMRELCRRCGQTSPPSAGSSRGRVFHPTDGGGDHGQA